MFVVKFQGGLGNQLFHYAGGFASSIRRKAPMKMDLTAYGILGGGRIAANNSGRDPDLLDFAVSATTATCEEATSASVVPFGFFGKKARQFKYKYLVDYYIGYRTGLLSPERGRYMDGYFQDDRYFAAEWPRLAKEFQLRPEKAAAMRGAVAEIDELGPTVSLHVRRGDYVATEHNRSILDVCGLAYYRNALREISASVHKFTLVIFSDEPKWVRANLDLSGRPIAYAAEQRNADGSRLSAAQEMILMSGCTHNIIANSTFSWWGAYLNSSPDKIVVAPKVWARRARGFGNILPGSWRHVAVD